MLKQRNRSISMEQFQRGSAYWDITEELAKYILYNEKLIERAFKNTNCCYEVFIQTLIWNLSLIHIFYGIHLSGVSGKGH